MNKNQPIGLFDSGVGGLTVVHEVFNHLPHEEIVYFGDTARVPYGTKSARVVQEYALEDARFLKQFNVKMIVVACHTASSVALEQLKDKFEVPVLGVTQPGVDAAVRNTQNGRIGVIGTRGTITSGTYERLFNAVDSKLLISGQPCPLFVPLAEEGWLDQSVTRDIAKIYLTPLIEQDVDTIVLGCTHYPLLKSVIQEVAGESVRLIDSAEETARVIRDTLYKENLISSKESEPEHQFFVSDIPAQFREIGERFLGRSLQPLSQVNLGGVEDNSQAQK